MLLAKDWSNATAAGSLAILLLFAQIEELALTAPKLIKHATLLQVANCVAQTAPETIQQILGNAPPIKKQKKG